MALVANVSFSKKIPVEGEQFSSQGYSLTLQTEIAEQDPAAIQARLHETFELVKRQVETELANGNGPRDQSESQPAHQARNGNGSPGRATSKQIAFLIDVSRRNGIEISQLNAMAREYGADGIYELSKRDCSTLIDSVQGKQRRAA